MTPPVDEVLSGFGGAQYFTSLNLKSLFWRSLNKEKLGGNKNVI